jgi:hypothetical protein
VHHCPSVNNFGLFDAPTTPRRSKYFGALWLVIPFFLLSLFPTHTHKRVNWGIMIKKMIHLKYMPNRIEMHAKIITIMQIFIPNS